ncbi:MAG: hypothetical protein ACRCWR_12895 [Saezia sp.]
MRGTSEQQVYLVDDVPHFPHALTWLLDVVGILLLMFPSAMAFLF